MKVRIIFNSEAVCEHLSTGWGFSCLVNNEILFDTGEKGSYLFNNLAKMDIDIAKIKKVVISHDHWDHTGGLWKLLEKRKGMEVYACPNFSEQFKQKVKKAQGVLIELKEISAIAQDIFVTGEIPGTYNNKDMPEQALIINTKNGMSIITGCAHPGILKILRKVKAAFPPQEVYAILGGFHLKNEDEIMIEGIVDVFQSMKVKKAGPTHCSGKKAEMIFRKEYGDNFITLKAGETVDF
ncbi:MAG: MBL fold metallo-hydrolase [Candidatus Omnitrophica bacterium]|nr:MBL fold metallo-hydrolase [Candidatus Omnitrophota bacterium]